MSEVHLVTLRRNCEALEIPAGVAVTLPAGAEVDIAQSLGGHYTVILCGGLFRIASKDADALGLAPESPPTPPTDGGWMEGPADEQPVWAALRTCYDPEIPVNIVDLGLVYDLSLTPTAEGRRKVSVKMTLTAPGCGMGRAITEDARQKLLTLPGIGEAEVELVWDPPWHQSMISPEGKRILGISD